MIETREDRHKAAIQTWGYYDPESLVGHWVESGAPWGSGQGRGQSWGWGPSAELQRLVQESVAARMSTPDCYQDAAAKLSSCAGVVMGTETDVPMTISTGQFRLLMAAIGMCEEAGEFAGLVKKHIFHGHPWDQTKATKELGDTHWYTNEAASAMGVRTSDIQRKNIEKLHARYGEKFSSEASMNRKPGDD